MPRSANVCPRNRVRYKQWYRAGITFVDADAQLLDELCVRHRVE